MSEPNAVKCPIDPQDEYADDSYIWQVHAYKTCLVWAFLFICMLKLFSMRV